MPRHLLTGTELSREDIGALLHRALELKAEPLSSRALAGKSVALVFHKPSTRTRLSYEAGIAELGGHPLVLRPDEMQLSRGESVKDTARILSSHVQAVGVRTGPDELLEELAAEGSIPVFNMLTAGHPPSQALADLLTLHEAFPGVSLDTLKLAYVGDGNNVAHSLMLTAGRLGVHVAVATPERYAPNAGIAAEAAKLGRITITYDPAEALAGAHAVYTDVWASMGQETEAAERARIFTPYQVNENLFAQARPDAVFLHCLPAKRGQEVTDAVIESPRSVVFDQAENRLHAQKALLLMLLG